MNICKIILHVYAYLCRRKKHRQKYDPLIKLSSNGREHDIKERVKLFHKSHDYKILCLIDVDLVAEEAKYHNSCYEAYVPPEKGSSSFTSKN